MCMPNLFATVPWFLLVGFGLLAASGGQVRGFISFSWNQAGQKSNTVTKAGQKRRSEFMGPGLSIRDCAGRLLNCSFRKFKIETVYVRQQKQFVLVLWSHRCWFFVTQAMSYATTLPSLSGQLILDFPVFLFNFSPGSAPSKIKVTHSISRSGRLCRWIQRMVLFCCCYPASVRSNYIRNGHRLCEGMIAEEKSKKIKRFFSFFLAPNPRSGPDSPRASG